MISVSDYIMAVSDFVRTADGKFQRWSSSNYFGRGGDLGAPGGSDVREKGIVGFAANYPLKSTGTPEYLELHGTSQAAPHVAAAAAMLFALPQNYGYKGNQIKKELKNKMSRPVGNGQFLDLSPMATAVPLMNQPIYVRDAKPPDQRSPYERGVWAFFRSDLAAAERELGQAAQLHPYAADARYFLAFTQACRGDLAQAETSLRDALELDRRRPMGLSWNQMMTRFQGPQREALIQARVDFFRDGKLPTSFPFLASWASMLPAAFGGMYPSPMPSPMPSVTHSCSGLVANFPTQAGPRWSERTPCSACFASGRHRFALSH